MSRHYEERYYVKDEREISGDYEDHHRSTSRARSSSRHNSRHRQPSEGQYYRQKYNIIVEVFLNNNLTFLF